MSTYYEVLISAETQEQADNILNPLLEMKLATGGQFVKSPARFAWKGKVVDTEYITITSFTKSSQKDALIKVVEKISSEEVPMIRFIEIEPNKKLCQWIDETLA